MLRRFLRWLSPPPRERRRQAHYEFVAYAERKRDPPVTKKPAPIRKFALVVKKKAGGAGTPPAALEEDK
jgi:hypothetical protein